MANIASPDAMTSERAIWLTTASHFLNDAYSNVYPTLVPLVAATMGFGLVTGSLVITGVGLASSAIQPLFGAIADRRASTMLAPATLAIMAVCTALLGFVHDALLFVVIAGLAAMANGAFHPASMAFVRTASGTRPGWFTSIFFLGGTVGQAAGPLLAVAAAALMGVHGLALLAVPGILLAAGLAATARRRPAATAAPPPQSAGTRVADPTAPSAWHLLRQRLRPVSVVMAIAITRSIVTISIATFWPLLHRHSVAALFGSSAVIAVMMVAGGLGILWGGRVSDRVPHHTLLAVTCVGATLSLGAFALASGPWIYPLAVLSGLFGMSGFPVTTIMGQNLIPERVAMASGLVFGLANALAAALVALLSLAAAAWGGPAALLLAAGICLCGLPASLAYPVVMSGHRRAVGVPDASPAAT